MKLKLLTAALCLSAFGAVTTHASAATLDDTKARGTVRCGVNTGLPGFGFQNDQGQWAGLDVDYCKAIAAAIFNDRPRCLFAALGRPALPGAAEQRGRRPRPQHDLDHEPRHLARPQVRRRQHYDGQGFMVRKELNVNSALQLSGATVCVQSGTTTELNLADYFAANNMQYNPVVIEAQSDVNSAYDSGRCDVLTTDQSGLYASRLELGTPDDHVVLPEIISKEPLGPAVRQGDDQWFNVVKWTHFALLNAEELGVTQANVEEMKNSATRRSVACSGVEGTFGADAGLSNDFVVNIVKAVGNYGELFERNVGTVRRSASRAARTRSGRRRPPVRPADPLIPSTASVETRRRLGGGSVSRSEEGPS